MQVLCTNAHCKKTHVIIPDFLNPYKRYVGAEIEAAVDQESSSNEAIMTEAEESTINRWRKQFSERLPEILSALMTILIIEYENIVSLLDCSQGIKRIRKILMHFPIRKAVTTLGRTNLELFAGGRKIYF